MNTIHQIPFVTKQIRPKLMEDGKPYFEDSFRKISKCSYTSFLRNDYKGILKQFGITEILHTALACLVHAFVRVREAEQVTLVRLKLMKNTWASELDNLTCIPVLQFARNVVLKVT